MTSSEVLRIARRYSFAFGRGYLSTFLSALSMAGLVLAIALLIIVLSVMNGFDKEMRERILNLVPHVTIYAQTPIEDWQRIAAGIAAHPEVVAVEPFAHFDALLMRGASIETARVIGSNLGGSESGGAIGEHLNASQREAFEHNPSGIILGHAIANNLGLTVNDTLTVLIPGSAQLGFARGARYESLTLEAILTTGTELDQNAALVHLPLAAELAGHSSAVTGLQIRSSDIFEVSRIGWELINNLPVGYYATNWLMTHGNLYSAIQLSRNLVSILLFSIIAVAAFNVVSSLVLVVFDKRGDIAILRTLGTAPAQVAQIFVAQGAMIGFVGVVLGSLLGVAGSYLVPELVAALEQLFNVQFLNTDVYPVSFVPVDVIGSDIVYVAATAFVMCIAAAIYPAYRASKLAPALVLNQD